MTLCDLAFSAASGGALRVQARILHPKIDLPASIEYESISIALSTSLADHLGLCLRPNATQLTGAPRQAGTLMIVFGGVMLLVGRVHDRGRHALPSLTGKIRRSNCRSFSKSRSG